MFLFSLLRRILSSPEGQSCESRRQCKIKTHVFIFIVEAHPVFARRAKLWKSKTMQNKNACFYFHCWDASYLRPKGKVVKVEDKSGDLLRYDWFLRQFVTFLLVVLIIILQSVAWTIIYVSKRHNCCHFRFIMSYLCIVNWQNDVPVTCLRVIIVR